MWFSLLALLSLDGCLEASPEATVRTALPALRVEDGVVYAELVEVHRAPPARFGAPLPTEAATLARGPFPRWNAVHDAVCAGTGDVREQVLARLVDRSSSGWGAVLGDCTRPDFCTWAADHLDADLRSEDREALWDALSICEDSGLLSTFVRDDAPMDARITWFWTQTQAGHGVYRPELLDAARWAMDRDGGWLGYRAVAALSGIDHPDAAAGLIALYDRAEDPAARHRLALAMEGQSDPKAHALFRRGCDAVPDAPSCVDPLGDLDAAVQRWNADPAALLDRYPSHAGAIRAALARCVEEGLVADVEAWTAERCLDALYAADPEAARQLVGDADPSTLAPALDRAVRTLQAYPEGLEAELVARGLVPERIPVQRGALDAVRILEAHGVALSITTAYTGTNYDSLARDLAAPLDALDGVIFASVAPPGFAYEALPEHHTPRHLLYAWMDGIRYQSPLEDWEEYFEAEPVVAFLNTLLKRRGATERIFLADGRVIPMAPDTLQWLLEAELLMVYDPTSDTYLDGE